MTALAQFILDKLDTMIIVIDLRGSITYVNPAVKNMLGYDPNQLIGQTWELHTQQNSDERQELKANALNLLRERKLNGRELSFSAERSLKDTRGKIRWMLWNLSLGPGHSLVGIGQDITERKKTEMELRESLRALAHKNKEMVDSISYSERIQRALLPKADFLKSGFTDIFALFKPKDIVSGDFYWFYEANGLRYLAAIDCTGHGVPGALMTMLAHSLLKGVVKQGYTDPGEILMQIDRLLYEELNERSHVQTADGMDIALCVFDPMSQQISFSGAFRPLIRIRNGNYEEFKGARYPIGLFSGIEKQFTSICIDVEAQDRFYIFSDGYADQFGGQDHLSGGKKLNKKAFRQILLDIQSLSLEEQEGYLDYVFSNWKQQLEQTDDVLVMGFEC